MKMNKTLLLKASAFFLLLSTLLFSCGIPTYFYVVSNFSQGSGDDSSVSLRKNKDSTTALNFANFGFKSGC